MSFLHEMVDNGLRRASRHLLEGRQLRSDVAVAGSRGSPDREHEAVVSVDNDVNIRDVDMEVWMAVCARTVIDDMYMYHTWYRLPSCQNPLAIKVVLLQLAFLS
jgi:hypothetical protein